MELSELFEGAGIILLCGWWVVDYPKKQDAGEVK